MKAKRQRKIIELITEQEIFTQEELAKLLEDSGFSVTQATVSRDIRELNLTKVAAKDGGQKYVLPSMANLGLSNKFLRVLNDGVLTIKTAENILVIKTVSGMAMAVAAAIDAMNVEDVLGCIAGDDTIMCVVTETSKAVKVKEYLEGILG